MASAKHGALEYWCATSLKLEWWLRWSPLHDGKGKDIMRTDTCPLEFWCFANSSREFQCTCWRLSRWQFHGNIKIWQNFKSHLQKNVCPLTCGGFLCLYWNRASDLGRPKNCFRLSGLKAEFDSIQFYRFTFICPNGDSVCPHGQRQLTHNRNYNLANWQHFLKCFRRCSTGLVWQQVQLLWPKSGGTLCRVKMLPKRKSS